MCSEKSLKCSRRCFPNWNAISQAAGVEPACLTKFFTGASGMILPEWTISDLQEGMESGELTARRLAELYLERIQEVDKNGPYINSVIELNPDALEIAGTLDAERKAGKTRSALHGIPILIKDNIDTNDRMQTTAGSL